MRALAPLLVSALLAAAPMTSAAAGVYAPTLGPSLDPTLSFVGTSPAFTVAEGAGSLTLAKAAGVGVGDGTIYSTDQTSENFDVTLTFDDSQLGDVGLALYAYGTAPASGDADIFYDGPGQFQSYISQAGGGDSFQAVFPGIPLGPVTFDIVRVGDLIQTELDGVVVNSATYDATSPWTFAFQACAGDCIATQDFAQRSALVTAFSVTTSAVPEPGSWTLMILGFGAVGAAVRRRPHGAIASGSRA